MNSEKMVPRATIEEGCGQTTYLTARIEAHPLTDEADRRKLREQLRVTSQAKNEQNYFLFDTIMATYLRQR